MTAPAPAELVRQIRHWGQQLGLSQIGIADIDLSQAEQRLQRWLEQGYQGEMDYMARHGSKRSRPAELEPDTCSVISARLDYLPPAAPMTGVLANPEQAYVSRYALGRDYHKLLRKRLALLAGRIAERVGPFRQRVFVDSAPVLEKPLAEKAGLGWIGKHSNLINRRAGSWFFLGEIYTDLALPADSPAQSHCGRCRACLDICPTAAIVAPYVVDARRCISYLTIELKGPIPLELRPRLGNRIYGCDDCQLVCPWNRFARPSAEADFLPRQGLDSARLCALFAWDEAEFLRRFEGSPIRRIGHLSWLRNIATALGNGPNSAKVTDLLKKRLNHPAELVREHSSWALNQLNRRT
ncbi:tRNA epoxyqueuosine(34) reductase QueG [Magnetovirga frankeli]|uniref:tRNA epoxyqueuosine(34) reductase QueG n=1 Tax=Magnetovirga frankeli TaxID=947516 RepID=UPI0012936059|nr:tRNA epoxyqueuosine(34) reductase QueG [gamma proteobacterium SS-5]